MMRLVAHLDWKRFSRRIWIISSGDTLSETKALAFEKSIGTGEVSVVSTGYQSRKFKRAHRTVDRLQFRLLRIPRARRVHQSYLTSPFSTLYSLAFCLWHIAIAPMLATSGRKVFADLVLLNGPGSCVPITIAAFLPRVRDPSIDHSEQNGMLKKPGTYSSSEPRPHPSCTSNRSPARADSPSRRASSDRSSTASLSNGKRCGTSS